MIYGVPRGFDEENIDFSHIAVFDRVIWRWREGVFGVVEATGSSRVEVTDGIVASSTNTNYGFSRRYSLHMVANNGYAKVTQSYFVPVRNMSYLFFYGVFDVVNTSTGNVFEIDFYVGNGSTRYDYLVRWDDNGWSFLVSGVPVIISSDRTTDPSHRVFVGLLIDLSNYYVVDCFAGGRHVPNLGWNTQTSENKYVVGLMLKFANSQASDKRVRVYELGVLGKTR